MFNHMLLKDIDLIMGFKNIMLDAANLAQYLVKLIALPISFCIAQPQAIQFYISIREL